MKYPVYNKDGKELEKIEIAGKWKDVPAAGQAIKDAVVHFRSRGRRSIAKVKDRSEVNFTTRKPWRQKGTGRARAGTASSPIWRKGGVVFGPHRRDFSIKMPKKARRLALRSALADKVRNKEVVFIDNLNIEKPKTKIMEKWLRNWKAEKNPLVVAESIDKNVRLAARNIAGVGLSAVGDLNTYNVLVHKKLVVEKNAWKVLEKKIFFNEKTKQ